MRGTNRVKDFQPLLDCLNVNANPKTQTGVRWGLTMLGSTRDKGLTKGSHSSGVRAEMLRNSPATRKRRLNHRFMMLQLVSFRIRLETSTKQIRDDRCRTEPHRGRSAFKEVQPGYKLVDFSIIT